LCIPRLENPPTYKERTANDHEKLPCNPQSQLSISFINAAAYQCAYKSLGTQTFQLSPIILDSHTLQIETEVTNLAKVPLEYYQFADVFNKQYSKTLPDHCPYDLNIQMTKDMLLPLEPIYSLSMLKLKTLQEFVEENVKAGTI